MSTAVAGPIVAFVLLYFIGHRVAEAWAEARKRRELNMDALNRFFDIYGEFFAVWKLWNSLVEQEDLDEDARNTRREALHERAAVAEGQLESFLIRLTTQFKLTDEERDVLGSFRQGYQRLRKSIHRKVRLSWDSSSHPPYAAFKGLAAVTALRVENERVRGLRPRVSCPERAEAVAALRQVTSNRYETGAWVDVAAAEGLLNIGERQPARRTRQAHESGSESNH
jgi:hypothetical protein